MDAEYLKRVVGVPLSEALTAMVVAQPQDAVEFLGQALLDHVRRAEEAVKKEAYAAKLQLLLEEERLRAKEAAQVW